MSRLRRIVATDKWFFITCNVSRTRAQFGHEDFEILARAMDRVRSRRLFFATGYVLMPDHWHALIGVPNGQLLPHIMNAIKVAATFDINRLHGARGPLWQPRYFDRVMRTVREYHETLEYMHLNPMRKGFVVSPAEWLWSSIHSYGSPGPEKFAVDRIRIPADENAYL